MSTRTGLCLRAVACGGVALAIGCGSSYPAPSDRLTSAEGKANVAREIGASEDQQAALHLKLADDGIARSKTAMRDGDNRRADYLLMRAEAEALLATTLAKAVMAQAAAQRVIEQTHTLREQTQSPASQE